MFNKKGDGDLLVIIIVLVLLFFAWRYFSDAYYTQKILSSYSENMEKMSTSTLVTTTCSKSCSGFGGVSEARTNCMIECANQCKNSPSCAESFNIINTKCTGKIGIISKDCKNILYTNVDKKAVPYCCMDSINTVPSVSSVSNDKPCTSPANLIPFGCKNIKYRDAEMKKAYCCTD